MSDYQRRITDIIPESIAKNYEIFGGKELKGAVDTLTSKNCLLALMYSSLLSPGTNVIKNAPKNQETERTREVFHSIGARTTWDGQDLEIVSPDKPDYKSINATAAGRTRAMIYLMGVLPHYYDEFTLPVPGGCKLGKRTISAPYYAMEDMGFKFEFNKSDIKITVPRDLKDDLKDREIVMYESSDTGTNIAILAALSLTGTTTIKMASSNYMVQDMCFGLVSMGAKIEGIGTSTLVIHGTKSFDNLNYETLEDPIESMFFVAVAATTNSEIEIRRIPKEYMELELLKLSKMGFKYEVLRQYKSRSGSFDLIDVQTKKSNLKAPIEKLYARPFPGLNIDNLPFFVPIATRAKGQTLIHDWVYENRAIYYMEFQKLGADILLADPHRVYINGPTDLNPTEIVCPPALRPSVVILIGMLVAKGKSILRNTYSINRGYEDLFNRLKNLGADIKEID